MNNQDSPSAACPRHRPEPDIMCGKCFVAWQESRRTTEALPNADGPRSADAPDARTNKTPSQKPLVQIGEDSAPDSISTLVAALKRCNSGDIEADHGNADDLLIEYINDPRVKEAYDAINKWYA